MKTNHPKTKRRALRAARKRNKRKPSTYRKQDADLYGPINRLDAFLYAGSLVTVALWLITAVSCQG